MIIPSRNDIRHKRYLFLLLREILKNPLLSVSLMFKGGTYASLRGILKRFSVDLDFDLLDTSKQNLIRKECYKIFKNLGLDIKDESKKYLQFFLKYSAPEGLRNTLKFEVNDKPSKYNLYEKVYLNQVNMFCNGQTLGTVFANKLVACKARFEKNNNKIAGRDFYDIHQFFMEGIKVNKLVVEDLSSLPYKTYLESLILFIQKHLTEKLINQDLNPLLEQGEINKILPTLKDDLLFMIDNEIKNI